MFSQRNNPYCELLSNCVAKVSIKFLMCKYFYIKIGQTHENRFPPLQNLIPKMHLFLVFVANNSKITNPNSLFCTETQLLNNELITIKTLSKTAWSHLEARAKAYRRQSEG